MNQPRMVPFRVFWLRWTLLGLETAVFATIGVILLANMPPLTPLLWVILTVFVALVVIRILRLILGFAGIISAMHPTRRDK